MIADIEVLAPIASNPCDSNRLKLWDHLFIMSDHKLDVESPYPIPQKKEKRERPKIINNTQGTVKYRHYGKFVIDMLKKVPELKNEDTKNKLIISIANQMKRSYVNWNKSNVLDDVIFNEIEEISNGNIKIPQNTVLENIHIQHHKQHSQYKSGARRKTNHRQKKYK